MFTRTRKVSVLAVAAISAMTIISTGVAHADDPWEPDGTGNPANGTLTIALGSTAGAGDPQSNPGGGDEYEITVFGISSTVKVPLVSVILPGVKDLAAVYTQQSALTPPELAEGTCPEGQSGQNITVGATGGSGYTKRSLSIVGTLILAGQESSLDQKLLDMNTTGGTPGTSEYRVLAICKKN